MSHTSLLQSTIQPISIHPMHSIIQLKQCLVGILNNCTETCLHCSKPLAIGPVQANEVWQFIFTNSANESGQISSQNEFRSLLMATKGALNQILIVVYVYIFEPDFRPCLD